jgi:methylmalonyl-CoA mutase N-terminal domain/subunit
VRIALRTQQIIAYESGVADTLDPLAGSYLIERLTDEIERQAEAYIQKIDERGGALAAIEQGYVQTEIAEAAYRYQRAVERQEQVVVGVNKFVSAEEINGLTRLVVDPAIEAHQRERLAALRARRDDERVNELLSCIESTAQSEDNLMPLFIKAVENDVTLGEICGVLRAVWGEYQPEAMI